MQAVIGSGSTARAEEPRPAVCWVLGFSVLTRQPQGNHTVKEVSLGCHPGQHLIQQLWGRNPLVGGLTTRVSPGS